MEAFEFDQLHRAFESLVLPPEVVARAGALLADDLSLAIDASQRDFGRRMGTALHRLHHCRDGIYWPPVVRGLSHPDAALLLGALIHAAEQDDTHVPSIVHGGAVLVPTALLVAQTQRRSGRELLRALVLGWEVLIRMALRAPGAFQRRGFQASAVLGPLAAALVAGWLQRLPPVALRDAVGIALSFSAGPLTYLADGADSKKLHLGWAARSGIVAAELAAEGITGPGDVLGGERSVYRLFADGVPAAGAGLFADLGEHWHLLQTSFKRWPCCHYLQGFVEAVATLRREAGARAIRDLHCHVPREVAGLICRTPRPPPSTDIDARFSLAFVLKAVLLDGRLDAESFEPAAIERLDARAMPVSLSWQEWADSGFPACYPARVEAVLDDGTRLSHEVRDLIGSPTRPLGDAALRERFVARTVPVLGEQRAQALWLDLTTLWDAPAFRL